MNNIKHFLAQLSHHPGVYQMLGEDGKVLYVGKAKDLKKRVSSYFNSQLKDPKTISLVQHIHSIEVTVTTSENEAVLLECNLIKQHKPRYNILLRDDKSYPYIVISHHVYPRIDLYRGQRKKNGYYFGPYPSALAARETISLLQKLFRLRTCDDHFFQTRSRPCLLHQIGRCSGPCVSLISKEEYARQIQMAILFLQGKSQVVINELQAKMATALHALNFELASQYRDQIARLRQIQIKQHVNVAEGNADIIGFAMQAGIVCLHLLSIREGQILGSRSYFPAVPAHSTMEEIVASFLKQHYLQQAFTQTGAIPKHIVIEVQLKDVAILEAVFTEQSNHHVTIIKPTRGEKKKWLAMATSSAKQSLAVQLFTKANVRERLHALQIILALPQFPARVECFDISHYQGEATVASCVVFDEEGPHKSAYRRFNITDVPAGDDVAAMRQVLLRRFKRLQKENAQLPNIIFIDGGKTQLSAAQQVMAELNITTIILIGISKGAGRKPGYETLHRLDYPPLHLPADAMALHFIQQVRDEAHRFAITGHRQRRDKTRRTSTIEAIPGVGAKRRRELLRYFGGIQGLAHASLDELVKVPGISRSLAERIFTSLHDATI